MYESLGTQILHATGDVCHELHQHLSGQELGQRRKEWRSAESLRSIPPPSLLLSLPVCALQWFPMVPRIKSNLFPTRLYIIASCPPVQVDLLLPLTWTCDHFSSQGPPFWFLDELCLFLPLSLFLCAMSSARTASPQISPPPAASWLFLQGHLLCKTFSVHPNYLPGLSVVHLTLFIS